MHNINDLVTLIYDKTYWGHNPSWQPIIDFYFYKNLTGLKALSTLARDMYIPNLHASIRILSHKIFGRKVKVQDDEFANVRGKKLTIDAAAITNEFKMNLQTFINICRAWHITPVLMTQFNRYKRHPAPKVLAAMRRFQSDSGIPVSEFGQADSPGQEIHLRRGASQYQGVAVGRPGDQPAPAAFGAPISRNPQV